MSDTPTTEEKYLSAIHSSNLRMEADAERRSNADVLVAAGWSASRVGMALLRLHSEWDAAAKPVRPTQQAIRLLAETMPRIEKGRVTKKGKDGVMTRQANTVVDIAGATRLAGQWHLSELYKLIDKLGMLPDVRRELLRQAGKWRIANAPEVVPSVIKYWLEQNCSVCSGLKFKPVSGTPTLSNRQCHGCHGSGVGAVPHGQDGKRLCNYIDDCVMWARQSLRSRLRNTK
ncbi:hypothetical protein SAMN05216344_106112 [Polaromonas sp. OV174]|uniref:hypothetical protein n=1 Tax=Polaromonas sp. OV174 TaxID=1855300 RepID=UPI0008DF29FC|nr:hypothetical protein [Polaromonas sp. OV174]SFB96401.1 hypothetical protein SAMN05216344_106112 [Polaromonas sp. OV174]